MTKREYAEEVCNHINMKGYQTEIMDNCRNNGSYVAITLRNGSNVCPVFNIGDETEDPIDFADRIISFVPMPIDTSMLSVIMSDKEEVLRRSIYILVNTKLNENRDTLVRKPINDTLEIQYKIDVSDVTEGGTVALDRVNLEKLGITEEELYSHAYENTVNKCPYELKSISSLIGDLIGFDDVISPVMYVLTNSIRTFGASTILYKGIKEVLDNVVSPDHILIPSSIHEWIVVQSYLGDKDILQGMIREVNGSVLNPEDVLSDRPYKLLSDGVLTEL